MPHFATIKYYIYFVLCFTQAFAACVLVTGGAGFIGSHVVHKLHQAGYNTVVIDDLSTGNRKAVREGVFIRGDIGDKKLLDRIFQTYPIDAVMHFAAFSNIGQSVSRPLAYYMNNVGKTLTLLSSMQKHHVKRFIFSSSASVYGNASEQIIDEQMPTCPISPYGRSKLVIETVLKDLDASDQMRFVALRYFNAGGGDPLGKIKSYQKNDPHLIAVILKQRAIKIFGTDYETPDGTCIRDYTHIDDLADAHILAMERLLKGGVSRIYNLGSEQGYSVREVIEAVEKVISQKITVTEGARRAGDPPYLVADSSLIRDELGWTPKYSLEDIIRHAWIAKGSNQ